jgi:hypothetical protein
MNSQPENFSQFEKLLVELARSSVDFAVVGGIAVSLNGYIRATDDADILVQDSPDNLRKLLACLSRWGEGWARELTLEDFVPQEGSIRVMEEFDLDIFTRMRGRSLDDFRPRLRFLNSHEVQIPFICPSDLVYLKENSWREKDKLDVAAMRELMKREGQ